MNFIDEQTVKVGELEVLNYLPQKGIQAVRQEIIHGLQLKQKFISPKYFYDEKGSELFEDITHLTEYYPTRCEKEILSNVVSKLDVDFNELDIIELGSGDASKIKTIFSQISPSILASVNYYPVDISQSAIENSIKDIIADFDLNNMTGIVADFLHNHNYTERRNKRLFCFLGGTIGNLDVDEVERFMQNLGEVMEEGDGLLLGADVVKDVSIIEAAYNDQQGVTAEFNKNILNVINGHIHSDFDPQQFDHVAYFNQDKSRIEMHLKAKIDMHVSIGCSGDNIQIEKGETIHTENSRKFTADQLEKVALDGGLKIKQIFTDTMQWFNLVHFTK